MKVAVVEEEIAGAFRERIVTPDKVGFIPLASYHATEPRHGVAYNTEALPEAGLAMLLQDACLKPRTVKSAASETQGLNGARLVAPLLEGTRVLLAGSRRFPGALGENDPFVAMPKFRSAFADPGAEIALLDVSDRWDVDAVVGVVVGRHAFRVGANEANRFIAGYTLIADVTDRARFEAEAKTNNGLMAKNHRGLSALGPVVWIPDESDHVPGVVELRINGAVKQKFSLSELAWRANEVIAAYSVCPLFPGDIIGLGPAILRKGAQDLPPAPLKRGDAIAIDCAEIGGLRLQVQA